MDRKKIIDHQITESILNAREMMAKQLQQEFKRYHIEKDEVDAELLAEELTDPAALEIYTNTYQLEFLTDVLFEVLINKNIISFEKAQELWKITKNDEGDLEKTHKKIIRFFEKE